MDKTIMHPKIFSKFNRATIIADGQSVYDFLGGSINVLYKKNWKPIPAGVEKTPGMPVANEWYVDWLATLTAAYFSDETFQTIELGAGYAQWTSTAIHAFKSLKPNGKVYAIALEADSVHYQWMRQNLKSNFSKYTNIETELLNSAAGADGTVSFPVITDPSATYGASYSNNIHSKERDGYIEVSSLSLESIYKSTKKNPVDLLHVDIQGAEVDLLLEADPAYQLSNTKVVLIGTHRSDDVHNNVREKLISSGMKILIDWNRNSEVEYFDHKIKTHDGALLAINPQYIDVALASDLIGAYMN